MRWRGMMRAAAVVLAGIAAASVGRLSRAEVPTLQLEAFPVPSGQTSGASGPRMPIVLKWLPDVGEPGVPVPAEQAANERQARRILLDRTEDDDGRDHAIRWRVFPDGDYPARPDLFGTEVYPTGVVRMERGQRRAVVTVRTVETGRPDWRRAFRVELSDAETGLPVLDPYMTPIAVSFAVAGDLRCAPGRPDLCDFEPEEHANGHEAPAATGKPVDKRARTGGDRPKKLTGPARRTNP